MTVPEEILMDCCRVAESLPTAALAKEWGLRFFGKRDALTLDAETLAWLLQQPELAVGQAFVYANGCVVTAGLEPAETQALLLLLAGMTPDSDYEQMLRLREIRTVPNTALAAQARALSGSVVLDALEQRADALLDQAEHSLLDGRSFWPTQHRRRQKYLAEVMAFRYECVHGQGILDRPDTSWDMHRQRVYRAQAKELNLHERTQLLSHKLDELENLLARAHGAGSTRQAARQLWLEVWMLLLFPVGHVIEILAKDQNVRLLMQQLLRFLHLSV